MSNDPVGFSFEQFEKLPENKILESARHYVDLHLPSGANLEDALKLFRQAGAECSRGNTPRSGVYYECYYGLHKGFTPILTEWKVIIYPDANEKEIRSIAVNRGFTGL